jgi:hypothetical protein
MKKSSRALVSHRMFDDNWRENARTNSGTDSWANKVIETLDTTGQIYLSTLRRWFERFPLDNKQYLRRGLESLQNDKHVEAVNELAWWAFMQREGIAGTPLPTSTTPRPDFQLPPPPDCFLEVSTLNDSDKDKETFQRGNSVAYNEAQTIRRIIMKATGRKKRQLSCASNCKKAGVLALFDYTEWSGYPTGLFLALRDSLLRPPFTFRNLPTELSAIIYLKRMVRDGRVALSRQFSAVYYNPLALYPLAQGSFPSFTEFSCQVLSVESKSAQPWIWL